MIKYKHMPSPQFQDIYGKMYPNSNKKVADITFQVTEDCCLKCTYCYQTNKSRNKMSFESAKEFIDRLLNNEYEFATTDNADGIIVEFIGGEPFMEIDLINKISNYLVTKMVEMDHPWLHFLHFAVSTNGILVKDPRVVDFLDKYGIICALSISIDGNKELHDACRIDFNGNGSYDRAMEAVHFYKERYGNMPGIKMTLAPQNVKYIYESIVNLINEGYTEIYLNCVYEKGWELEHARIMYTQLKQVTDYMIENGLYDKVFLSLFDEDLFKPIPPGKKEENWCGGIKDKMIAIDHRGDIYPCIRYMDSSLNGEQEPLIIGSVTRGYAVSDTDKSNLDKISNITRRSQCTDECYYCPIADGCGWCSALNYQETGSVNKKINHICIMHKARALANVYHWNRIYEHLGIDKVFVNHVNKEDIESITGI